MIWSFVLTGLGVLTFWLAGRKIWWTWRLGLLNQALWLVYSLVTQQWGFLLGCVFYSAVYWDNNRRWIAERRAQDGEPK